MTNPEDDQLITDSLAVRSQDDYNRPYTEKCEHCGGPWHGQSADWNPTGIWRADRGVKEGCPGAYATDKQVAEWGKLKKVVDWLRSMPSMCCMLFQTIDPTVLTLIPHQAAMAVLVSM